jgi:hypothetical protein
MLKSGVFFVNFNHYFPRYKTDISQNFATNIYMYNKPGLNTCSQEVNDRFSWFYFLHGIIQICPQL